MSSVLWLSYEHLIFIFYQGQFSNKTRGKVGGYSAGSQIRVLHKLCELALLHVRESGVKIILMS